MPNVNTIKGEKEVFVPKKKLAANDENELTEGVSSESTDRVIPTEAETKCAEIVMPIKNGIKLNRENARMGFIYSEILGKPLSKRKR